MRMIFIMFFCKKIRRQLPGVWVTFDFLLIGTIVNYAKATVQFIGIYYRIFYNARKQSIIDQKIDNGFDFVTNKK